LNFLLVYGAAQDKTSKRAGVATVAVDHKRNSNNPCNSGKHDFILLQPGEILPVKGQRNEEYRVFLTFFLSFLLAASKQARPFLFFSFLA
jgi:hypothetical protein